MAAPRLAGRCWVQQGFPAITVPAGFTTEIWDRVRDPNDGTRLVGPIQASLPVGVDFVARPFDEPMLFRIGLRLRSRNPAPTATAGLRTAARRTVKRWFGLGTENVRRNSGVLLSRPV